MSHTDLSIGGGRRAAREWDLAVAVVAGAAIVRLGIATLLPLFPDEAYYWEWSRHLAAGYFDHPWGIAALIAGGTWVSGHVGIKVSAFAVRLLVIVAGFLASLAGAAIARRVGGDRAGLVAALIFVAMPLAASGMVLATPDVPLLAASAGAMYAVVRALEHARGSRASLGWWIAAGVALGLAFSSKYTSILIPVGITVALVFNRQLRARLREPGPYLACAAATLVFLPVLIWNSHHGWISFGFQLNHGLGTTRGSAVSRELNLLGGQAGLASPIILVMLGIATWRALVRPKTEFHFLLAAVSVVCFGTFALSALRKPVEANWPALAYVAAVPLLALTEWTHVGKRWLAWGIGLAGALSTILYVQAVTPVLPLPASRDPVARSAGWDQLADSVVAAAGLPGGDGRHVWVAGDRYQDASELAFNLPGNPFVFSTNLSGRPNQYDLWPGFPQVAQAGDNLVLVLDEVPGTHHTAAVLAPHFRSETRGALVPLTRSDGSVATRRRIWILRGWKGTWPDGE